MRILIAEDERDLKQLIKKRLKDNGYSVDACFNGKEVFDYLLCAEYDALILDIMMPKMDGISVLRELRKEGNAVPVLLLTAKDSIEDRVTGLAAGPAEKTGYGEKQCVKGSGSVPIHRYTPCFSR